MDFLLLAVHQLFCIGDGSSKCFTDGLMSKADAQDRQFVFEIFFFYFITILLFLLLFFEEKALFFCKRNICILIYRHALPQDLVNGGNGTERSFIP